MGAIPIVAGAVGVVGTIAQIREQNAAVRRANTAANFSGAASYSSEAARLQAINTQRQLLANQYEMQAQQRMTDMQFSMLNFRQELVSNQLATQLGVDGFNTERANVESQLNARTNAVLDQRDQYRQAGEQAAIDGANESIAAQNAAGQAAQQGTNVLADANRQLLDLSARTSTANNTASSNVQGALNPAIEEAIQQLMASGNLSTQAQDAIRNSTEFRNLLNQLGASTGQSALSAIAADQSSFTSASNLGERAFRRDQNLRGGQLAEGAYNVPLATFIDTLQGAKDYRLADFALLSGVPAIAAAGFAERSAIDANRPVGNSFISSLARVGQSSVPLVASLMQSRSLANPATPINSAPAYSGFQYSGFGQPTQVPALDYLGRGVLTDVANPINTYA